MGDDEIFTSIIQSMGIHNYDPLVITALNEYARRYAGSLLIDAKDYAEHADRPEMELEDMQIAVKLSDERTLGLDPRQRLIQGIERDINTGENRDLLKLLNKESVLNRYPPGAYKQRCYSYIPGIDSFQEEARKEKSNNVIPVPQKKRSASSSFHPSNSDPRKANDEQGEGEVKKIRFISNQAVSKDRKLLDSAQGFTADEE
mmetsp:Transcript_31652/g.30169  ORF Transcript_31652/g.30169 Transcript_31652/m.30169 type:complete len:202 (+) Transcript_31652:182-787(+)